LLLYHSDTGGIHNEHGQVALIYRRTDRIVSIWSPESPGQPAYYGLSSEFLLR